MIVTLGRSALHTKQGLCRVTYARGLDAYVRGILGRNSFKGKGGGGGGGVGM